jgi:hypothetical protein
VINFKHLGTTLRDHEEIKSRLDLGNACCHEVQIVFSKYSSGRIVSDYGLDDRAIGARFPVGHSEPVLFISLQPTGIFSFTAIAL